MPASPNALKAWIYAARPKTLIAGVSPVLIGASMAAKVDGVIFALCLLFSLFIQIGANFANDYFDYIKGADTSERIGPARAAQSGWLSLNGLKKGIFLAFSLAAALSIPLLVRGGFIGSIIVAASILFAIFYTAGAKPLGYLGLGELLVFIFYGPVATVATYYVLTLQLTPLPFLASLSPGLLSSAILIANNLRDEKTDRKAHKKTLVVRFGVHFGRREYVSAVLLAALIPLALALTKTAPASWWIPSLLLPVSYPAIKRAFTASIPQEFAPLLPMTAALLLLYTALFLAATC